MSKLAVTIEWVLAYSVGSLLMGGLILNAVGNEATRSKWIDVALFLTIFAGLGLIIWQGVQGHLPGTAGTGGRFFPFVVRFLAWSFGLGFAGSAVGAFIGYGLAWGNWSNRDFAIGLIIFPSMGGFVLGFITGAVIAVMKTARA